MMSSWKSKAWFCVLVVMLALGGVGYFKYEMFAGMYQAWRLRTATPEMHDSFVTRFESLGLSGTDALTSMLTNQDETACRNAMQVLSKLLQVWTSKDPRFDAALQQLALKAPGFSTPGQVVCLNLLQTLLATGEPTPSASLLITELLSNQQNSAESRLAVFNVLVNMLGTEGNVDESLQRQAKTWVIAGLRDENVNIRIAAIRLAVAPGLQLHEHLTPLLAADNCDKAGDVRQLAILALGSHEKLLSTDDLCRFLNDSEESVKQTTERALKVRGLGQSQINLARRMNDNNPISRAEVPGLVIHSQDVDIYLWMERLSCDPSPAVRAATARAMAQTKDERLETLMKKLMEQDQDPTVQQISRFYGKP